ncbi:MAG: AzlD domain-containing protein [Sulfurospirillum sp.]|nr:AzlD domain-containing protein [Sulfurospirillum sp.]
MFESSYLIGSIFVAACVTYATRAIPFAFFAKKKPSSLVKYFEINMPLMIMVILVFYALKDVKWEVYPYGLAHIIAIAITLLTYLRFNNALLSILLATVAYMISVQKIF